MDEQTRCTLPTGRPRRGGAVDYDPLPYAANAPAEVLVNAPHPLSSGFGTRRAVKALLAQDQRQEVLPLQLR